MSSLTGAPRRVGHRADPLAARAALSGGTRGLVAGGCRRPHRRYERKSEHFLAFVGIATTLTCHRRLTK